MGNANIKTNPLTTIPGILFIFIAAFMYCLKYILPAFMTLKKEIPYEWYTPLWPIGLGLLLINMNDEYFKRIFNRSEKIVEKVSHTEDTKEEEIK